MNSPANELAEQCPIVEFKGRKFLSYQGALIDPENKGGFSYAHIMDDGTIMRNNKQIGRQEDLVETDEFDTMSFEDILSGIWMMLGGRTW